MRIEPLSKGLCPPAFAGLALILAVAARADDFAPPKPSPALVARFLATLGSSAAAIKPASVPVVPCPADGQTGPVSPANLPKTVTIQAAPGQAERLAYYKAEPTGGVLAPRGWRCFGRYGSDGSILTVAPPEARQMLRLDEGKTGGPVVVLSESSGQTSGRFAVAAVAARIFPVARKFAEGVRDEGIAEPGEIVFAPWPHDTVNRLSDRVVAYLTPARAQGLGTSANVAAAEDAPVRGIAFLTGGLDTPDLTVLRVRLGKDADLYPAVALNALPGR